MKATVNPNLCTGCGLCEIMCPEVFRMNGGREAFAFAHSETVDEEADNFCVDARDCCNPNAIRIVE